MDDPGGLLGFLLASCGILEASWALLDASRCLVGASRGLLGGLLASGECKYTKPFGASRPGGVSSSFSTCTEAN